MSEGYGSDWTDWDAFLEKLFPRPKDVKYKNWCPFVSPKGQWMAFYSSDYGDIKIVKLPSMEVVVDKFYSNFDEKAYASHTNHSTYVPGYQESIYKESKIVMTDSDFEDSEGGVTKSIPIAFNAWTIWAADHEFYVDIIDLSLVDDGVIKLSTAKSFEIPISASHVRNFVHCDVSHWYSLTEKKEVGHVTASFKYLQEISRDRYQEDSGAFYDMYKKQGEDNYSCVDELPWVGLKRRIDARKKA